MVSQTDVVRVASIPGRHPYVDHLELGRAGIGLLADPPPPGAAPGQWWPPVMLDAHWIEAHARAFDVLHLHFGAESSSIAALSSALDALERAGRPCVYTAHDLVNPQLADQTHHRGQLELLMARAAAVITLTDGAAQEIHRRWGRTATVIPHPRMLQRSAAVGDPVPEPRFTVGVHLRDLRPNIDGAGTVRALADALEILDAGGVPVHGRVALFPQVRDQAARRQLLARAAGSPLLTVIEAARVPHRALIDDLGRLDASLLPYRYGTHSGWAELCWDLGLPVVGADVGYIAQQHSEPEWFSAVELTDPSALAAELARLASRASPDRLPPPGHARRQLIADRRRARDREVGALGAAHRRIYLSAVAGTGFDDRGGGGEAGAGSG